MSLETDPDMTTSRVSHRQLGDDRMIFGRDENPGNKTERGKGRHDCQPSPWDVAPPDMAESQPASDEVQWMELASRFMPPEWSVLPR